MTAKQDEVKLRCGERQESSVLWPEIAIEWNGGTGHLERGQGSRIPDLSPELLPNLLDKREHRLPACAGTGKMPVLPVNGKLQGYPG